MALSQRLEIRQSQALVMTPQLMQAIKLLALSNLDLAAYVEGELERNPLLERIEDGETERASSDRASTPASDASSPDWADPGAEADRAGVNVRPVAGLDDTGAADADAAILRSSAEIGRGNVEWSGTVSGQSGDNNLEAFVSAERRSPIILAEQLALTIFDPVPAHDRSDLIDLVEAAGYSVAISQPSASGSVRPPPRGVEAVLAILQGFDPPGVCARSGSEECLALQLRERDRFDPRWRRYSLRISICSPEGRSRRRCAGSAAWTTRI